MGLVLKVKEHLCETSKEDKGCAYCFESSDILTCVFCVLDIDKDSVSMVLPMHPGANILISPWICESCGFKTSSSDIMSIMTDMSMKLKLVVENKKENGSEIVEFIQTHTGPKGILHPKNHIILSAKNAYCETCFQNSTDKGAMFTIGKFCLIIWRKDEFLLDSKLLQRS